MSFPVESVHLRLNSDQGVLDGFSFSVTGYTYTGENHGNYWSVPSYNIYNDRAFLRDYFSCDNYASDLLFVNNGVLNPRWNYTFDNVQHILFTLSNGYNVRYKGSSESTLRFSLYLNDIQINDSLPVTPGGSSGDWGYVGLAFFKDSDEVHDDYAATWIYMGGPRYSGGGAIIFGGSGTNDVAKNSIAPTYTWKSWSMIKGNNGQYKSRLTMIIDEDIASDISGYHGYADDDFIRVSNESSIWNTFLNAQNGVEYDIAWSGRCKATLTVTNDLTDNAIKIFTFKFYFPDQSTPFFTKNEYVTYSSAYPANNVRNYFLTFLYDNDNESAAFYGIRYNPQSVDTYQTTGTGSLSSDDMTYMWMWLQASSAGDPEYPYDTGSTDNGGDPNPNALHNDDIINITPPTMSGMQSGLFTVYCPSETDLVGIAQFLWSDSVIDNFKKYFNNFSDNIIALYVLPYKPSNLPTKAFKVGRVVSDTLSAVEYTPTRFVTLDMGELTISKKWDSYLDFSPFTKLSIYLPGIGVQALDTDDIMCPADRNGNLGELGSTLKVEYNLDLMTGIVAAFLRVNGQIRYQFTGKIGYEIPLTGETHRTLMQGFAIATAGAVGSILSGGTMAPFAASAITASVINAIKPDAYRGGNLGGDAAALCYQTPYLIRRMPNKPLLVNQDKFTGFQSYKTGLLSEFSGYTEVVEVHAEGFSCSEEEREEIIDLLKKGVIL